MFNRTARATSWAFPLLLAALLLVAGVAGTVVSAMGAWS